MDADLEQMTQDQLITEVAKLRQGIREHRDSSGHDLCWHHPALWSLLPEKTDPIPRVPDWPEFMQGCVRYRQSLDLQAPNAPRTKKSFEPVTIPTERLTLRFLGETDLPALYDMFSHPEVMRYWSYPAWSDRSQARQMLTNVQEGYHTREALQLGIERRADHSLVGTCTLFHFHVASRRAEIGYALGRPYWGAGYMHEALQALLRYAFHTLDLNRLEADIDPRNLASARTLDRLGFQKEGHLRDRWIVKDETSDTGLYGLLRREWQQNSDPA